MDNFTHSLAGWALGQAGLKTQTRKGLAALILGANMPDIDVVFGWLPYEPLAMHRGMTHSLVTGIVVMPAMLGGLLLLLDRWQVGRGTAFGSGLAMRAPWLVALCYLGAISHPLLDLLTTYSVQLISPFSGRWFHADALFIIDVWVWTLLAGAIAWSRWREKGGRSWRRPVHAAIAVTLGYIGINLLISQRAYAAVRNWAGERPAEAIFSSPEPALSWRRELVWREGDCYRRSTYDPLGVGFGAVTACEATGLDDPLVRRAIRDPALGSFMRWSILPQAVVRRSRCSATVIVGDARYGPRGESRLSREIVMPTAC
jgi:inner membrane protein